MEEIIIEKTSEIRKNREELEKKLNTTIQIKGKKIVIEGNPLDEYEASIILDAIGFGFTAKKALILKEESMSFKKISIKDFTKRKKLNDVRSRVIGAEGKTKRTIEEVSDCSIVVNGNDVGIIGSAESIDSAVTALTNLIRGSKQGNVYNYLERMNKEKKKYDNY